MDAKSIAITSLFISGALLLIAIISYNDSKMAEKRLSKICTCQGGTKPCDCDTTQLGDAVVTTNDNPIYMF